MKNLLLSILILSPLFSVAQSVGIGTQTPDPSALLEVYSLEKGFLPPRMRTTQRLSIPSPAVGLLVYDTETHSYWVRRGDPAIWVELLHSRNALWRTNMYGTTFNTDQKHVSISNSSSNGVTEGVLNLFREEQSTNDVIDVLSIQRATTGNPQNGIGGSILFRNEVSNHSFSRAGRITALQENAELGSTKSAMEFEVYGVYPNVNNIRFNMNGLTIGAKTPAVSMLDVKGDISLTGEVRNPGKTGSANLVPISYGNVQSNGSINTGSGNFSVNRTGIGTYYITITGNNYHYLTYLATVTPAFTNSPRIAVTSSFSGDLIVRIFDMAGNLVDGYFNFVVHKP
jgi:hypothetical protein